MYADDGDRSLAENHASVPVRTETSWWRRLLAFSGPAFMVSVGYMDPGNWATDLAGGARFGYRLLWVILLSNAMAIVLQTLAARLGIVAGRDLAQACRDRYPRPVVWILWIVCEVAIAACDLAEILGSAIALHLLFGLPILWGVVLTALDVMLLLALQSRGIRHLEAFILTLVATVGACFALEMFLARPPVGAVALGFVPSSLSGDALYIAIGIIGATVMPHNLYLHSALVQTRAIGRGSGDLDRACRYNLVDTVVALNAALFVNGAILILAASVFHARGLADVARLEDAHALLAPLLGTRAAAIAFAVALLAAGQSSTVTGTLAGQVVMEGFVRIRLRPWARRLITRSLAIVPAVVVILWKGEGAVDDLLILSQVVLSLQLPFAVLPLIRSTSDRSWMGRFATPRWGSAAAWTIAGLIVVLNARLVGEEIAAGLAAGDPWVRFLLLPVTIALLPVLAWVALEPRVGPLRRRAVATPPAIAPAADLAARYGRIGVCLENGPGDEAILEAALPLARAARADVVLLHVVESAAARFLGETAADEEARDDSAYLEATARRVRAAGLRCRAITGAGEPEDEIARLATEEGIDLLVTGSHGHGLVADLVHGATVSELRHRTRTAVLSVRTA